MIETKNGVQIIVERHYFTEQLFKMGIVKNDKYPSDLYRLYFSYIFDSIRRNADTNKDRSIVPFIEQYKYLKLRFEELPFNYNLVNLEFNTNSFILKFEESKPTVPDLSVVESFNVFSSIIETLGDISSELIKKAGCYLLSLGEVEKFYIGESRWLARRLGEHKSALLSGDHLCRELQDDFNKTEKREFDLKVTTMRVEDKFAAEKLEVELIRWFNRKSGIYNYRLPNEESSSNAIVRARNGKITLSQETLLKMSATRKGMKLTEEQLRNSGLSKAKAIMADGIWFESATDCARRLNLVQSTVTRRLSNDKFPDWYYIGGKGDPNIAPGTEFVKKRNLNGRTGRRVSVEGIIYLNAERAAKQLVVTAKTVQRRCGYSPIDYPQWKDWFFVDTDE